MPEDTSAVELVSRLIDEIRADPEWRHDVRRAASDAPGDLEEAAKPDDRRVGAPLAPPADAALAAALSAADAALAVARAPVAVEPGRPLVGEAWAVLRRQIHADVRIYLDRQDAVDRQMVAALRRIQTALDVEEPTSVVGAVWAAFAGLHAEVVELGRLVRRLQEDIEPRLSATEGAIAALESAVEPLGALRVAVDELASREQRD